MRADFVVTDRSGTPRAAIEVKRISRPSAQWAREFRANLLESSNPLIADYFAIVTPDELYLWSRGAPRDSEPAVFHIGDALQQYLPSTEANRHEIAPQSLEILVASWLRDLSRGVAIEGLPADFVAALRRGIVSSDRELDA